MVVAALSLFGCKREPAPDAAPTTARSPVWYRAVIRGPDGIEIPFFVSAPAPGEPGQAIFKVGPHEVRTEATFDGKTLKAPMPVHQTAVDATVGPDGTLIGTFSTTWRAWGASSLPLTATKVSAPAPSALATVAVAGPPLDLGGPRTVWKIVMNESGNARLVVNQPHPGELDAVLYLDTGNIIYLAGNGVGNEIVLTGFDGTSGYRLELDLDKGHAHGTGEYIGGHKLDWREKVTATLAPDYELELDPNPVPPGATIGLPDLPEIEALEPGPLLIEIGGSWCSTCRNAAPLLVDLYREYHPRGLRIISLLYEFDDDRTIDLRQVEEFKKEYGVTWPVISVPGALEDFADIMPTGLNNLNPAGYPFTVFLAADRTLVALHIGFPASDATSAEYKRTAADFRKSIEKLLAGVKK